MTNIRESLTLCQFVVTSIINIADTILFFLTCAISLNLYSLKYLTNITLILNASYLFLAYICDISFYILKLKKLEGLNYFLRFKLCNIINPVLYLVFFLFWILVLSGGIKNSFESNTMILFTIYAHLFIPIFVICDIFVNDHDMHKFSWKTFGFILLYNLFYFIIIIFCQVHNIYTYEFLDNIPIIVLIIYGAIFIAASFCCYHLHVFIFRLKYKYIIKIKEKQFFNEEINKIIQMGDLSKGNN